MDLSVSLKAVISQRLVHDVNGDAFAAVELMLNTQAHPGADQERRDRPDQGGDGAEPLARLADFEQALFRLYADGKITLEEAMATPIPPPTSLAHQQRRAEAVADHRRGRLEEPRSATDTAQAGVGFEDFKIDINAGN